MQVKLWAAILGEQHAGDASLGPARSAVYGFWSQPSLEPTPNGDRYVLGDEERSISLPATVGPIEIREITRELDPDVLARMTLRG